MDHAVALGRGGFLTGAMMGIERVGPAMTAQAGMIGPLSTLAMGVLILNEPLTSWLVAGTVLVIAGIYVFSRGAGTPAR